MSSRRWPPRNGAERLGFIREPNQTQLYPVCDTATKSLNNIVFNAMALPSHRAPCCGHHIGDVEGATGSRWMREGVDPCETPPVVSLAPASAKVPDG